MSKSLTIWVVATHSDRPINNRIYKAEEMMRQVKTWTKPYKKPVLVHHDDKSDPIGRVTEQVYVPKHKWDQVKQQMHFEDVEFPEEQSGQLLVKQQITDADQIAKVRDGRYHTVSVGFSAKHLYCSICGADIASGETCEHEPGQEYDGEVCYHIPTELTYKEISFVNVPADDHAVVAKHEDGAEKSIVVNGSFQLFLTDSKETTCVDTETVVPDTQNVEKPVSLNPEAALTQTRAGDDADVQVKQEAGKMENTNEELRRQYEELKAQYDQLLQSTKEAVVNDIIDLKQELGHDYTDEQLAKLREYYNAMSLETLVAIRAELEDELEFIYSFLTDSEKANADAECEKCKDKAAEEKQPAQQPEPVAEQKPVENPVGFVNKAGEIAEMDQLTLVKKILRVGGDSK